MNHEYRFKIIDLLFLTTCVALVLTWIQPRWNALGPAARRNFVVLCLIAFVAIVVRQVFDFVIDRRRVTQAGYLILTYNPWQDAFQGSICRCGFVLLEVVLTTVLLFFFLWIAENPFDWFVGFLIVPQVSIVMGGALRSFSFFRIRVFERGFFLHGRYFRWSDFCKASIQTRSQQEFLLLLDAVNNLPLIGYSCVLTLPTEKLGVISEAMQRLFPAGCGDS